MLSVLPFYLALLGAEATIAAIFLSGVMVYTQIVSNRFSYRLTGSILLSNAMKAFFWYSTVCFLTCAIASFVLINSDEGTFDEVVSSAAYSVVTLEFFLASIGCLPFALWRLSDFLAPRYVLGLVEGTVQASRVADYTRRRYGLSQPTIRRESIGATFVVDEKSGTIDEIATAENKAFHEAEWKQYDEETNRLASLSAGSLDDPFLPIMDLATTAIETHDYAAVTLSIESLEKVGNEIVKTFVIENRDWRKWSVDKEDEEHFARLHVEHLSFLVETAESEGHESVVDEVTTSIRRTLLSFIDGRSQIGASVVRELAQKIAENAIENRVPQRLRQIVLGLSEIGVKALNTGDGNLFDDTCRLLGHLGELAGRKSQYPSTILGQYLRESPREIDSLTQAFDELLDAQIETKFAVDPLIYRDGLFLFLKSLLTSCVDPEECESPLISLGGTFARLGIEGARCQSERAVSLVLIDLPNLYKLTQGKKWRELDRDMISWMFDIGMACGNHNRKCTDFRSLGSDLIDIAVSQISSAWEDRFEPFAREAHIRSFGKGGSDFTKRLAKKVNSNFGLYFDPVSGETYGSD